MRSSNTNCAASPPDTIVAMEQRFEFTHAGIPFVGSIDRIDERDGRLTILDYKVKENLRVDSERNVEKTKDFQLEIYALAAAVLYPEADVESVAFYDVRKGYLVEETLLEVKAGMFEERLGVVVGGGDEV